MKGLVLTMIISFAVQDHCSYFSTIVLHVLGKKREEGELSKSH